MLFNRMMSTPLRPVISFDFNGTIITYDGNTDVDIPGKLKIVNSGLEDFKMWIYDDADMDLGFIKENSADLCLIGHGGSGGGGYGGGADYQKTGGGGGGGGAISTILSGDLSAGKYKINLSTATSITTIDGTVVYSAASGGNGTGGYAIDSRAYSGGNGGNTGGGTSGGQFGAGQATSGGNWWAVYGSNGQGANYNTGHYAFNDSAFDGILYCYGGGGGSGWWTGGSHGTSHDTPGSGGYGGGSASTGAQAGQKGVIILRKHVAA